MIEEASLLAYPIPEIRTAIRWQDVALYNLSIGLGQDPMDLRQLPFTYEPGLRAMPSMAVVLGYPGFWVKEPETGVDWVKVVHGEQSLILHKPLPASGEIVGTTRVTGIVDRGPGKGAMIYSERVVRDAATGEKLATLEQTTFARGDGGFGGKPGPVKAPHPEPQGTADLTLDLPTRPEQAAYYRLNGDHNPLHIDPEVASKAGFPRPILHGLCTFGVVCHALMRELCDYDPARFGRMDLRFSSPVFPGETIRTEIWRQDGGASFRARVVERDIVVVSNGFFAFS
ncbi:MAG: 3-Alpha,7-alpha, 12-alpha-trihydroxy-5-beta-cholest-24-enoyl-CoA hydratase [Rubritepida sp.]|nr:3-Alpha,7-alpha, 12-alpha-trihydroxy-5-beta-cholest-24-enoyl-CoA hydratase [Rubritepida sp.]